jgi:hypothetical protein
MTPDERQMLSDLFDRIRSTATGARDPQAEAFINDAMRAAPFAPYVLAQTVLVQQQALDGAARRISELEAQTRQSAPEPQQETSFLGNLGRSLFGGPSTSTSTPPQARPGAYDASAYQRSQGQQPNYAPPPSYAPPQQQGGPWGGAPAAPSGGGFLSGALHTAAGVAGGVLLGNALEGMIGGRGGGGGLFGGGGLASSGFGGTRETVNNYYEAPDAAGQHAEDVLQDQDQDQDDAQDAADDSGGGWDSSDT